MKLRYSTYAQRKYRKLSPHIKQLLAKQTLLLLSDFRHPSLRVHLYKGKEKVWQARINNDYRFYFEIHDEDYIVVDILSHPK